ncbi:S-layer homology domain-containing protein [Cohnella boryungensis]|uniref:S-layer homology domain-containing protein n=1 Tax=Cohnella boryungensis TaxID=768479 RepID=A0ABV8SE57_9BACL
MYADDGAIPPWARGAVYDLRQLGIIGGRSGNRFEPAASVTRAEAAVVLLKYLYAAAREDSN